MANQQPIPVIVNGAAGKMGREVIKTVAAADDMTLFGAIDHNPDVIGLDVGEVVGGSPLDVAVTQELEATLAAASQQKTLGVIVDFTHPRSVYENVRSAIAYGIRPRGRYYWP